MRAYYNGSLEISETYNRITLDNQRKFTPPILLFTVLAIYLSFRSWRKTLAGDVRDPRQPPLDARPVLADGLQLQRARQHARAAHRRAGDCRRRAHHAALGRGAPARRRRARVQGHGRASGGAAPRRERDDGARHAVAGDEQRRRRQGVRRRIGRRDHGGLRDLARPDADAALARQAGDGGSAARALLSGAAARPWRGSRARSPARVLAVSMALAVVAAMGMLRLRVDTNHISFFSADHPLGQSAAVIDKELGGRLQLSDHAGGAARVAEDARRAAARRPPRGGAAAVSVRPQGDVGRRLREADQQGAQRRTARGERRAGRRQHDRAGAVRLRARRRRPARARARGRERLLARADLDQAAVDELGPRARAGRGGGSHGEGGLRRHRHHGADDRVRTTVQHARSLSGDVAAQQLRHGVLHRLRRHLPRLSLVPLRPADDCARTCCRCWPCSA